mmetsp:Transcript_51341/g.85140  ORF Transcript_51341/g.85140 Transcript_51341/m.85140 type:complete len:466 (-) Transcript_51341:156-1553(-)
MSDAKGGTTTTVTLSLPALIQQLKDHVAEGKRPQLDELVLQAQQPEQHAAVKQQMSSLATQAELRAAVNALLDRQSAAPAAAQQAAPEAASKPESDLPMPLEALFGDMPKEEFRTSLIHAFHCRTPSCPVPGCLEMTGKLERLHQHVSSCSAPGCILCRIWTYLKYYRDSGECTTINGGNLQMTGGLCHALYVEPLLQCSQLLPRWQNGKISWVPPRDALAQLHSLTTQPAVNASSDAPEIQSIESTSGPEEQTRKRPRRFQDGRGRDADPRVAPTNRTQSNSDGPDNLAPPLDPQQMTPFLPPSSYANLQGVLQTPTWPFATPADPSNVSASHQQATAALGSANLFDFFKESTNLLDMELDAQVNGAMRQLAAETPGVASASWSGKGHAPSSRPLSNSLLPSLPMSSSCSGISLNELLKQTSFSDIELQSLTKSRSEIKAKNVSEHSLGSFIERSELIDILAEF